MITPLLVLAALGCASSPGGASAAPPDKADASSEAPVVPASAPDAHAGKSTNHKMHDRFREAFGAHDALLMGDLNSFREQMSRLARDGGVPGEEQRNADFRKVAARAAMAADADGAARGFAETGAACGACHASAGFPYRPAVEPAPDPAPDVVSHMTRHFWASERLWEGLVSGRDEPWNAGAEVLDEAQLSATALPPLDGADASALAAEVHRAGEATRAATTTEQRVAAYTRFISTCQACHTRLERPPGTELTPELGP